MGNCCVLKPFGICEVEQFSVVQEAGSILEFTMQPLVTAIYQYTHEFQHTQCLGAAVLIPMYGYKEGTGLKQENTFAFGLGPSVLAYRNCEEEQHHIRPE